MIIKIRLGIIKNNLHILIVNILIILNSSSELISMGAVLSESNLTQF